jgi:hypothetical protein
MSSESDMQTLKPAIKDSRYEEIKLNPRSWQMLGLDYRPKEESSVVLAARLPPLTPVTRLFRVDKKDLQCLKNVCLEQAAASGLTGWISTADSLTTLLWSSILRARTKHDSRGDTISTLMMAMDVRRHLEPPISNTYLGNCVLYSRAESTAQEISRSLSLGSIAQILRASLREVQQIPVINETLSKRRDREEKG